MRAAGCEPDVEPLLQVVPRPAVRLPRQTVFDQHGGSRQRARGDPAFRGPAGDVDDDDGERGIRAPRARDQIGTGAAVIKDVAAGLTVVGVPARPRG